jgi:hypothetical protein
VLTGRGGRAVERALAPVSIEACVMSARQYGPDDALAVDIYAAGKKLCTGAFGLFQGTS